MTLSATTDPGAGACIAGHRAKSLHLARPVVSAGRSDIQSANGAGLLRAADGSHVFGKDVRTGLAGVCPDPESVGRRSGVRHAGTIEAFLRGALIAKRPPNQIESTC